MQGKTIAKTETSKGNVLLYEYTHPNGPGIGSMTTEYAVEDVTGKVYYFPINGGLKAACDKYKELVAAAEKGEYVAVKCEGCFTEWYSPNFKDPYEDNAEYRQYYDKVLINDIPVIGPSLGNSETEYISNYLECLTERLSVSVGLGTWEVASGLLADMITASLTDGKPRVFKFDGMDDVKITPYTKEELPPVNEKSLDVYKDFKELIRERVAALYR